MAELTLGYQVHSYSSGTKGRALVNARTHHWVADGGGGEAVGAGELFLSGIAACAVNMVERIAGEESIPLDWMDVNVASYRDADADHGDLTLYDAGPGELRDMGHRRRPSPSLGGALETALTPLRFGRRGDPGYHRGLGFPRGNPLAVQHL